MAKISVIIPVYKVEDYLEECLDSILRQTFSDFEIILADEGEDDKCWDIMQTYAKKDSRIKNLHKKNGGYGASCNNAFKIATGKYISIIEPDDYIAENMFEVLYNYAEENDADIVKSGYYDNFNLDEYKSIKKVNWYNAAHLNGKVFSKDEAQPFLSFHPSIWTCLYKLEFLNKNNIWFLEDKPSTWVDNLFQVQTFSLAEKIFYTNEAFYYWRRKNIDDSKDLRDYKIPIKRTLEIHKWLNNNNIDDEKALAYLCRRELRYLEIVIKKLNISNFLSGVSEITKVAKVLDKRLVDNKILDITERKELQILLKCPSYFVLKNKTKLLLKPFTEKITDLIILALIKSDRKIVFWGGSIFLEEFLEKYNIKNKNILGIIDKDKTKENKKIGNYTVFQPEKLEELKPDMAIFTVKNRHEIIYPKVKEDIQVHYPKIKLINDIFIF